jgi:hypothetical protein
MVLQRVVSCIRRAAILVALVALFFPWITIVVIARRFPETRPLTDVEAGTGIAFLALVIGYLPVIYQAFSRREASISLLDARAGSPPSAAELLRRHADGDSPEGLMQLLRDWSAGQPSCWKATSPTRRWPTIAPSMTANPGWRR